jgi:hypothetical protein
MIFSMWHQAEHKARLIAHTCNVGTRTVWVGGVGECDLIIVLKRCKSVIAARKASFAMGNGAIDILCELFCPN